MQKRQTQIHTDMGELSGLRSRLEKVQNLGSLACLQLGVEQGRGVTAHGWQGGRVKGGSGVYGLQVNKEMGVADLPGHSLCRGQCSGHTHPEWGKLWLTDSHRLSTVVLSGPRKVLLCL